MKFEVFVYGKANVQRDHKLKENGLSMAQNLATRVRQFGFASQAVTSVNSRKLATSVKFSFFICKFSIIFILKLV